MRQIIITIVLFAASAFVYPAVAKLPRMTSHLPQKLHTKVYAKNICSGGNNDLVPLESLNAELKYTNFSVGDGRNDPCPTFDPGAGDYNDSYVINLYQNDTGVDGGSGGVLIGSQIIIPAIDYGGWGWH